MRGIRDPALPLALLGVGATVVTFDLAVRPIQLSPLLFWLVAGAGVALMLPSLTLPVLRWRTTTASRRRDGGRRKDSRSRPASRLRLAATECRRAGDETARLMGDADDAIAASRGPFVRLSSARRLRLQTLTIYRNDYRSWVTDVFDEAAALGAVSPSARALLQGRDVFQLRALPKLFYDAAANLEDQARA